MSEQLFLEAFNSEPYFFEKEEKYGAMDIIYTFEDEAGHGFKFHFEKKVALGKYVYVCVLSQKTPGLKTYKRVIGKFSNPMRTVATLLAVVRDIHDTRKDVHGIVMSIPEQAFGSYARLVKKIMTRELRTVLNVEDGEYTPEDFEKMGLVGIVTTVKPRNMNTVYTGPALKEYQERQAGKDGAGISTTAAVVPDVKAPSVVQTMPSQTKEITTIVFEVTRYSKDESTAFNASVFARNTTEGGVVLQQMRDEIKKIAGKNGQLPAMLSKLTYIEKGVLKARFDSDFLSEVVEMLKKFENSTIKLSGIEKLEDLIPKRTPVAQTMPVEDPNVYRKLEVNILRTNVEDSVRFEIVNRFLRIEMDEGDELIAKLHSNILSTLAKLMQVVPGLITRQVILGQNGDVELRFETKYLPKIIELIKKTVGDKARFVGLEQLEALVSNKPAVDPVAEKDPYYFDYDHRQITLTFDNAETAERIKEQLLDLGAATFNGNEFFTDKEKLILVDGNALDVKKVQETLFPILGNPLMMNGVFVDPNVRSSVRSPDGVVYHIKGNTIQVEDAPKDSAAKIVGMVIPGVERIFDDKGNNTIELNAAGIADGHEISNFVKVLKSISINEELSRYVFMDWDSIASDAMDKYDISTSSFKSLATNDGQYLIDDPYYGIVAEYTKTAGNVINGVVFKSTYRASDRITNLFSKDGYKVEHNVGGWGTQITIPLSSEFKLPAHDNLAKLIKELDNQACFDQNRSVVEYVGGKRSFIAKFMPKDSRVGLRLPTDDAGYLAWRDYTSYATSPNFIRFDNIETLDQFQALVAKVKDFDFGANLLRNIGASKYFADVRSDGPEAKKTYKLKDGGEVEITFEFGDKVMIAFNQASQGFDKDLSEWKDEKNEIFGRISAIALYKLGTADANKTLKNIDAWLDEHIVSKEDNSSSVSLTLNADFSFGDDYSASIENGVLQIRDQRKGVVASLSGINLDGVPAVVSSGVELHIREREFMRASFQGVIIDKVVSTDNVKIVMKKSDGIRIGRIELNSSAGTNIVNKEDNASKGNGHAYIADIEGPFAYTLYVDGNGPKLFETKTGKEVYTGECFYSGFQWFMSQASQKPDAISEIKRIANKYLMFGYEMKEDPKPFRSVNSPVMKQIQKQIGKGGGAELNSSAETNIVSKEDNSSASANIEMGLTRISKLKYEITANGKSVAIIRGDLDGRSWMVNDPKSGIHLVNWPSYASLASAFDSRYLEFKRTGVKGDSKPVRYEDNASNELNSGNKTPKDPQKAVGAGSKPKAKLFNDLTIKLKKQGNLPQVTINVKGDDVFLTKIGPSGMSTVEDRNLAFLMNSNPAYGSIDSKNAEVKRRLLQLVGASKSRIESEISSWTNGLQKVESISGNIGAEASKVIVPPTAPKSKNIVKPLISAIESVSKDGKEKKVTGFDLRVGETWAYDGHRGEMNNLLFISGPESTSLDSKIRSLGGAVLLRGVTRVGDLTIEFEDVAKKRKSKLTFTCGGLVQGSFESLKGSFSPATKSKVDKLISKMFTDSPQAIANEFADFIGNPDLRYKIVKDARKPAILISKNPAGFKEALANAELLLESQLDEGIKEDLTGKAPNRVKRELLESTLRKLGLYRESFTYGNATFKTVVNECSVEIVPTTGNIRNFAKMLGARLGQELRIDDEGFLSFDLDNI